MDGEPMDKKAKKKVLQMIPYGAYVVGTKTEGGEDHLMFLTWILQTSFKPVLVALALLQESRTLANVRRSKAFAVSVLREGMEDLAQNVLDEAHDKVKTARSTSGLPVVSGAAGWIECRLVDVLEQGDHRVVLAEVVDAGAGEGKPLSLDALGWHYGG